MRRMLYDVMELPGWGENARPCAIHAGQPGSLTEPMRSAQWR